MSVDKSILGSISELPKIPNFRCTLLKRPIDLPEDDKDERKRVALNSLGGRGEDMTIELDPFVQSSGKETTKRRSLNFSNPKGKVKTKISKRKSREALLCTAAGRVST